MGRDFPPLSELPLEYLKIFTILREPLDRAISSFRFTKGNGRVSRSARIQDVLGVARKSRKLGWSHSPNYYTRFLTNARSDLVTRDHLAQAKEVLANFASVIILGRDDVPASLAALGMDQYASANVSQGRRFDIQLTEEEASVTQSELDRLAEANELDIELFIFAKGLETLSVSAAIVSAA